MDPADMFNPLPTFNPLKPFRPNNLAYPEDKEQTATTTCPSQPPPAEQEGSAAATGPIGALLIVALIFTAIILMRPAPRIKGK